MIKNTCTGELSTYLTIRYFKLLIKWIEKNIIYKSDPFINYKALYSFLRNDIDEERFIEINQEILKNWKSKNS